MRLRMYSGTGWPARERGFTSAERTRRSIVAPSLAMSNDVPPVAAERDSQLAQRDEPAHSHTVSICGGVSPPTCHKRYLTSCDYEGPRVTSPVVCTALFLYV